MTAPEWLREKGLRARPAVDRDPVAPIPKGLEVVRVFDEAGSVRLAEDFRLAVESADGRDGLIWIRDQILDAMTGNRLSASQAFRLVSGIVRRLNGNGYRAGRVTPSGEVVELLPAGPAGEGV